MALYREGKAAMAADGTVTGTGTKWQSSLSLIRPGATIMFLSSPIQIAVVNKVVSDTEIKAITTNGAVVASTDYVILLSDSLTVDGLAQDVAETLRYYQSQETVIADAVEFFKDFDFESLQNLANQIKADSEAAESSATAAATSENAAKTSEANAKSSENAAKNSEVAAENAIDKVQQIINDAGEQSTLVALAQPDGAKNIGKCSSIAQLRNVEPNSAGQRILLASYKADGTADGGGEFYYDPIDSTTADDGASCIVTSGGKRWKAIINPAVKSSTFASSVNINAYLAKKGVNLQFDNALTPTGTINVQSNTRIEFSGNGEIDAPSTLIQGITIAGAAPTTFYNLSADALSGAYQVAIATDQFAVGDWIEIRSEDLVKGPNAKGVKQAQLRRVVKKETSGGQYVYSLDRVLEYDFLVASTARCGKATVIENVVLDSPRLNNINYLNQFGIGINCNYVVNLRIINPILIGSKDKFFIENDAGTGVAGRSAIKLNNCRDVTIDAPVCHHQGWYGVEVLGCSEDIKINDGDFNDCRHGVSVNWSMPYGEPRTVIFNRCVSSNATKAAFDTHDVGVDIKFIDCRAIKSQGDGFQYRARNVKYIRCYAAYCLSNGFDGAPGATGSEFKDCVAEFNTEAGFNIAFEPGTVRDCRAYGNRVGVGAMGGKILGGELEGNSLAAIDYGTGLTGVAAQSALEVTGVKMPFSDGTTTKAQPRAIYFRGAKAVDPSLATIRDCDINGYGNNWALLSSYSSQPSLPVMSGNKLDATGIVGTVTLVAGTATAPTASARKRETTNVNELSTVSKIKLTRLNYQSATPLGDLYVSQINNGVSFTIMSTSNSDVSKVMWEISL